MNIRKNIILSSLCVLVLCLGIFSCKAVESETNIFNGAVDNQNYFPAVLKLDITSIHNKAGLAESTCTASVISHNTLLTAAHCFYQQDINHFKSASVKVNGKTVYVKDVYLSPTFVKKVNTTESSLVDKAVVLFDDHVFDGIKPLKIARDDLKLGGNIVYVGYTGENVRKWGYSKITKIQNLEGGSLIRTEASLSSKNPKGINVFPEEGDSGGPIISSSNRGLILGVVSVVLFHVDGNKRVIEGVSSGFDDDTLAWLSEIDEDTKANIPLDEVGVIFFP